MNLISVQAGTVTKEFYASNVAPNAPISAGGRIQTWAGSDIVGDTVVIKGPGPGAAKPITRRYVHATGLTSGPKIFPPGLPIAATGKTAEQGYTSPLIHTTDGPPHVAPNSSSAQVTIDPFQALGYVVRERLPVPPGQPPKYGTFVTGPAVHGELVTSATAGLPTDGDKWHSADSFVGVEITAAKTFVKSEDGPGIPVVKGLVGNLVSLGGNAGSEHSGGSVFGTARDPYFLTVNDLTTGISTRQEFMTEDIVYSNANVVIDNNGIHLEVGLNDPSSFASIDFSSEMPWVLDPYAYSIRLDDTGLKLAGSSLGDWNVSTSGNTLSADLSFGPGGMPFDQADVMPDAGLFTNGDVYTYDIGEGGGIFEVATIVPEPGCLWIWCVVGLVGAGFWFLRIRQRFVRTLSIQEFRI
jgi:hypothetical protein